MKYITFFLSSVPKEVLATAIGVPLSGNDTLYITTLNVHPRLHFSSGSWDQFFAKISAPFLIRGNFNSKHISWGNSFDDYEGKELE